MEAQSTFGESPCILYILYERLIAARRPADSVFFFFFVSVFKFTGFPFITDHAARSACTQYKRIYYYNRLVLETFEDIFGGCGSSITLTSITLVMAWAEGQTNFCKRPL